MRLNKVILIGGGISGLAGAYRLAEYSRKENCPVELTVLESQPKFGGVIESESRDGFLLEGGPDSFISEKPAAIELCRSLGLEKEILQTQNEFRRSFIFSGGKLVPVPKDFYLIAPLSPSALLNAPLLSWPAKLRIACEPFIPPAKNHEDESVASFIRRRFGKEVLEKIGQPMLGGIFTGDPEKLSLRAAFPKFYEIEKNSGSLVRGLMAKRSSALSEASGPRYSLFLSLKKGMAHLTTALIQKMPDVKLRASCEVKSIQRKNESWNVILKNGEVLEADALCLALPGYAAGALLETAAPELANLLNSIEYASVATINMAFERKEIQNRTDGFGFVIPITEERKILAGTFASVKFPGRAPQDKILVRAFAGGALQPEVFKLNDIELEKVVRNELREILGITEPPLFVSIKRYPRSMAQYHVGHLEKVVEIREQLKQNPGLFLCGNAYDGVGIPACIQSAQKAADELRNFLWQQHTITS